MLIQKKLPKKNAKKKKMGGILSPRGVYLVPGVYLVLGDVLSPRGLHLVLGVYLVPGDVSARGVYQGGVCPGGMSARGCVCPGGRAPAGGWGVPARGVYLPRHTCPGTPPVDRILDTRF